MERREYMCTTGRRVFECVDGGEKKTEMGGLGDMKKRVIGR